MADWAEFFNSNNPNELWNLMQGIILTTINTLIKDKDRLLARAKRTMTEADWVNAKRVRMRWVRI